MTHYLILVFADQHLLIEHWSDEFALRAKRVGKRLQPAQIRSAVAPLQDLVRADDAKLPSVEYSRLTVPFEPGDSPQQQLDALLSKLSP